MKKLRQKFYFLNIYLNCRYEILQAKLFTEISFIHTVSIRTHTHSHTQRKFQASQDIFIKIRQILSHSATYKEHPIISKVQKNIDFFKVKKFEFF